MWESVCVRLQSIRQYLPHQRKYANLLMNMMQSIKAQTDVCTAIK